MSDIRTKLYMYDDKALAERDAKVRADEIATLNPFWKALEDYPLEWICDDLCGEFENPETGDSWCLEHCKNGTNYECIKKWCELKEGSK